MSEVLDGALYPQLKDKFVDNWIATKPDKTISAAMDKVSGFRDTLKSQAVQKFVTEDVKRWSERNEIRRIGKCP